MATIKTANRGNSALQTEIFTLSIQEAKTVKKWMEACIPDNCANGTYWFENFIKPTNLAIRRKYSEVKIYVGGFSTGNLANYLYLCGIKTEILPDCE